MTAAASAINAAEDGLLARIQAQASQGPTLTGVPMRLGDPGREVGVEQIWIAENVDATQAPATSGAPSRYERREEIQLHVMVLVVQAGDDYKAARDRAGALADEVERAVLADPGLGGAVWDATVTAITKRSGANERGRAILLDITVEAVAALTP